MSMPKTGQPHYIELPQFQGPLDLLLHLIQQEKVDIYDISLAKITDQFIQTLKTMDELDMEITSEFLLMASQLLQMKSRSLLPKPPKEQAVEEPEDVLQKELVERLVVYRAFKEAAENLGSWQMTSQRRYFREVDPEEIRAGFPVDNPLQGINFDKLWQAFQNLFQRAEKGSVEIRTVEPDEIPIQLMAADILRRLVLYPLGLPFGQLIRRNTRMEIVVAFLALLEVLKLGKIRCEQSASNHDIYVFPTEKAWDFPEEG